MHPIFSFFKSWRFAGFVGMFITGFAVIKYVSYAISLTFLIEENLLELAFTDASVTILFVYIALHSVIFSLIMCRMYKRKLFSSK